MNGRVSAQAVPRLTVEQFLEIERAAETKHEYYDGQMYSMAGGTYAHAQLIANLAGLLYQALEDKPCRVVTTELLVRTAPQGLHTYPDLAVICGEPRLADDRNDVLLNPAIIIEVLSKSTEAHDRGIKFAECRKIESLQEYALVSQIEPRIEIFSRGAKGEWTFRDFTGMDAACRFGTIDCALALARIYRNVPLPGEEPAAIPAP
jgi:Uma2 family endonuclease